MNSRLQYISAQIQQQDLQAQQNGNTQPSTKTSTAVWDIGGDHGQLGVDLLKNGLQEYRLIDPQRELHERLQHTFWRKIKPDWQEEGKSIEIVPQRAQDYFFYLTQEAHPVNLCTGNSLHLVICGMGAENIIHILDSWKNHFPKLPFTGWLGPNSYPHRLQDWLKEPFETLEFRDKKKERLLIKIDAQNLSEN